MHPFACPTRSLLRALLFAGLLLPTLPDGRVSAQPAEAPARRIDLEEALALALKRNLSLQQSANEVALSGTALAQQRAGGDAGNDLCNGL